MGPRAGMALSTMLLWWVNQHPLSRRTKGDGIRVRSLCWASHVCFIQGNFRHSIHGTFNYFQGFFSMNVPLFFSHVLFFFCVGVSGFPKKSQPFLMGFSRARSVESLQPSSPCVVVWMPLEIRQLSGIDGLMGFVKGWCERFGERLSGWQICKHIYIYTPWKWKFIM